jgi:hypothetical protein
MEKPVMYLYLKASFQGSSHLGGAKNLRGGKKKTLSTYLVTCVAVSKGDGSKL